MDWIVIMAGGGGTRLWPMSRRRRPKQFLSLLPDGQSLLAATVARTLPLCPIERTLIVTAASQIEEVFAALPSLPRENVVVEPEARNTAPCIGLACVEVRRRDPDAVLGVLPSDQHVSDPAGFVAALQQAFAAAQDHIVTVGIPPTRPETGFGYLQAGPRLPGGARRVLRFVEKPDRATAERYLESGEYLWNAGMFFFPATRMQGEIARHLPPLAELLAAIEKEPARTAELYPRAQKISIDYAVMEKLPASGELLTIEGSFGWNDVGSWDALAEVRPLDAAGNAISGDAIAIDARDNVLVTTGPVISVVGLSNVIVVVTGDAVLVLPRDRAQDVRAIVEGLEKSQRTELL